MRNVCRLLPLGFCLILSASACSWLGGDEELECTGSFTRVSPSSSWVLSAAEKGAIKIRFKESLKLTQFDLKMSASGATGAHLRIYSDSSTPDGGTLLASADKSGSVVDSDGWATFSFNQGADITGGSSAYIVFWTDGTGSTAYVESDWNLSTTYDKATYEGLWDNSGSGWNSVGDYIVATRVSYSQSSCSMSY